MFSQQCLYLSSWLALMFHSYMCMDGLSIRILHSVFTGEKRKTFRWFDKRLAHSLQGPLSFISSSISEDKVQVHEEGEVNGMWRTGDGWTGTDGCYSAQSDNMGIVSWVNKNR